MTWNVEIGPNNGPDDSDAVMSWVDITTFVNDSLMPIGAGSGRQTELAQINPGQFSATLNNADNRFTAGYTGGPYGSGFKTGMRVRLRETIGYRSFTHFDGNMLQPDLTIQTAGIDQVVALAATDRIGRLQNGRKFISTLAEYIVYNGGSTLKAYWPLDESRAPFRDVVGGQPNWTVQAGASATLVGASPSYTPSGGTNPPGDDARGILFVPSSAPFSTINQLAQYYQLSLNFSTSQNPISVAAGTPMTIVCWVNLTPTWNAQHAIFSARLSNATNPAIFLRRNDTLVATVNTGEWESGVADLSGFSLDSVGPYDFGGRVAIIGMQFTYNSPNAIAMWIDALQFGGTVAGTLSSPGALTGTASIGPLAGSISHFQIYVGAYTRANFLAQRDAGLSGLAGQYTGQRFRTIAQYAGVAAGDIMADPGTVRMQNIGLAGTDPLTVLQDAVTTEQGRLRVAGRKLIFEDDTRGYNR